MGFRGSKLAPIGWDGTARERRLKEKEEAQLLAACRKAYVSWLEPLVCLAIDTAMRQGELLSLTWENVDLDDGYAYIPADQTKTAKARTVLLGPRNREMLKQTASAENNGKNKMTVHRRVFPLTRNAVRLAWTRTLERAGITGLRFHTRKPCLVQCARSPQYAKLISIRPAEPIRNRAPTAFMQSQDTWQQSLPLWRHERRSIDKPGGDRTWVNNSDQTTIGGWRDGGANEPTTNLISA
ncbi:MAG: site-specific integrase [Acidiferrobacterales bacterium]